MKSVFRFIIAIILLGLLIEPQAIWLILGLITLILSILYMIARAYWWLITLPSKGAKYIVHKSFWAFIFLIRKMNHWLRIRVNQLLFRIRGF